MWEEQAARRAAGREMSAGSLSPPSPRRRLVLLALAFALVLPLAIPSGGPSAALAAECAGDECQFPAPPPDDPTLPTAVVVGPPNPPVHYPKVHKKKTAKKHRGHRRGRR
jgi:hypothetical protein